MRICAMAKWERPTTLICLRGNKQDVSSRKEIIKEAKPRREFKVTQQDILSCSEALPRSKPCPNAAMDTILPLTRQGNETCTYDHI